MSEAVADIEMGLPVVAEDEAALERTQLWRVLLLLLVFSPAVVMGIAIASHAVDVPMWDDWERGELWERYYNGELDLAYLDSPHIEHRTFIGRIATLAGGLWFDGDLRFEIWLTFVFVCATSLFCFYLLRHTLRGSAALWPAALLVNLLLFCPQQYSDFLWASMACFMFPFLCLVAMLSAWVSGLPAWVKTSLGVLAALVGTHSFSEGLMLWPVAICLPLCSPSSGPPKRRFLMAGAVVLVMGIAISQYFGKSFVNTSHVTHSYGVETGSRPDGFELVDVKRVGSDVWRRYFLSSLGNPLARLFGTDQRESARGVGRVLLVLSALALGFMFWRRRDRDCWASLLPWTAAGAFSVGVACMLAFCRSDTPGRSVMPRYIPMTLFLVIALVAIAAFVFTWWVRRAGDDAHASRRRAAYGWGSAAAMVVLLLNLWVYGFHKMGAWKGARLQARAALIYINHFDPVKIGRLDSSLEFVREQANILNNYHLLDPPLASCWGFACFFRGSEVLGEKRAKLESHNLGEGSIDVSGYALLPGGRIADGVLISVRAAEGDDWRVVGFAEMRSSHTINNIFLDTHFGQGPNLAYIDQYAGFRGIAVNDKSFADGGELLCWAIDAEKRVVFPIGEAVPLGGVVLP